MERIMTMFADLIKKGINYGTNNDNVRRSYKNP